MGQWQNIRVAFINPRFDFQYWGKEEIKGATYSHNMSCSDFCMSTSVIFTAWHVCYTLACSEPNSKKGYYCIIL